MHAAIELAVHEFGLKLNATEKAALTFLESL